MKTLKLVLVVSAIICFVSLIAYAQEMEGKGACRADVEKLCKDVKPGHGHVAQCMKQHEADLSPACKERIAEGKEKAQEFMKACKPDMEKFCKGIAPGKGKIYHCLKENEAQLSPECKEHLKK
jgi:hypothetical protein